MNYSKAGSGEIDLKRLKQISATYLILTHNLVKNSIINRKTKRYWQKIVNTHNLDDRQTREHRWVTLCSYGAKRNNFLLKSSVKIEYQ